MRFFAKDIAKTLGRPEAPLLQALNAEKICPYILEGDDINDIDTCCKVVCVKPDTPLFLQPCGHPIVWSSTTRRCMEHLSYTPYKIPSSLPILRRLEQNGEERFYVSEDSTVYNKEYVRIGRFVNGILTLFIVEE